MHQAERSRHSARTSSRLAHPQPCLLKKKKKKKESLAHVAREVSEPGWWEEKEVEGKEEEKRDKDKREETATPGQINTLILMQTE